MSDEMTPAETTPRSADNSKIAKAAAGIGAFALAGFALAGLLTKMILARLLGTEATANALNYVTGLTQDVFRTWEKLIRPVFLPVLAGERERVGAAGAWRFASSFINVQVIVLAALTIVFAIFAPQIVGTFTRFGPEEATLAARFLPVLAPSMLFLALAVTFYLLLNSYKRFHLAAFGDNLFVKLLPLAALVGLFHFIGVWAIIVGIVLGALGKLVLYVWGLRRELAHWRPHLDLLSPAMKKAMWLITPLSVGSLAAFLRNRVQDLFLTHVHAGKAVTMVGYAKNAVDIPVQVLPAALSIAIFPFISEYFVKKRHEEMFDVLGKGARIIFLAFLPLTVALTVLARPAVDVLFGGGKFTPSDVDLTAQALQFYAAGCVFFGLEILLLQFFYAAADTVTPTWTGILTSAVQILVLWLAVSTMQATSFTFAYSLSKTLKVLILLVLMVRVYPHAHLWVSMGKRTGLALGKIALVSAVMGAVVYFLGEALVPGRSLRGLVNLAVVSGSGGIVFLGGVHLLGVEEWQQALGWVKGKLVKR